MEIYQNIFTPENPQILGCRFLDALVLIRGILLYGLETYRQHDLKSEGSYLKILLFALVLRKCVIAIWIFRNKYKSFEKKIVQRYVDF